MRLLAKLIASLVILLLVTLGTFLTVLSTDYGLPLATSTVDKVTPYRFQAEKLEYDVLSPFSLTITSPQLTQKDNDANSLSAEYLSLNLSLFDTLLGTLSLNNVVVRGASLSEDVQNHLPDSLFIKHLAMDGVSYQGKFLRFGNADIQLSDWKNSEKPWGEWQGEFLFSAPRADIDGQPLTNLLLDSEFIGDKWEVWGLSFNSPFGNVTGSATQESARWTLHQLTLSDARIEPSDSLDRLMNQWATVSPSLDIALRRFDLLDVSASLPGLTVEHLNLSAQSVYLKNGELVWAPRDIRSLLSFNASLIHRAPWVLTDVLADIALSPSMIDVSAFSTKINDEGFVSVSGKLDSGTLALRNLTLSGLDIDMSSDMLATAQGQWSVLNTITVEEVSVRHTGITLADPEFPLLIAGLNLDGEQLTLRQEGLNGMWQGTLTASAAAASINRIPVSSPYAAMRVENGVWRMDPLNLSFQTGQLEARATLNLTNPSHPWTLSVDGLSIPTDIYRQWLMASLPLSGEHDINVSLSGLGADKDSFAYSLTGTLSAQPQRTLLLAPAQQPLAQSLTGLFTTSQPPMTDASLLAVGDIKVNADRGRISLQPVTIRQENRQFSLSGQWDLVTGEGSLGLDKR